MPITLLNINVPFDQENFYEELKQTIKEINHTLNNLSDDELPASKKLVLKNKLITLQNMLAGFLENPQIPIKRKQPRPPKHWKPIIRL